MRIQQILDYHKGNTAAMKFVYFLLLMSTACAIAAGVCATAAKVGPCAPDNEVPRVENGCMRKTCSAPVPDASVCKDPYDKEKQCYPSEGSWSCSAVVYPIRWTTNEHGAWIQYCDTNGVPVSTNLPPHLAAGKCNLATQGTTNDPACSAP